MTTAQAQGGGAPRARNPYHKFYKPQRQEIDRLLDGIDHVEVRDTVRRLFTGSVAERRTVAHDLVEEVIGYTIRGLNPERASMTDLFDHPSGWELGGSGFNLAAWRPALPALRLVLANTREDPQIRSGMAFILGDLAGEQYLPDLRDFLIEGTGHNYDLTRSIYSIGGKKAMMALAEALPSIKDSGIRDDVTRYIGGIAIGLRDAQACGAAADVVKDRLRKSRAKPLAEATDSLELSGNYRFVAAQALAALQDDELLSELKTGLSSPDPQMRKLYLSAYGSYRSPETMTDLMTFLLNDPEPEVKRAAADALSYCQGKSDLGWLADKVMEIRQPEHPLVQAFMQVPENDDLPVYLRVFQQHEAIPIRELAGNVLLHIAQNNPEGLEQHVPLLIKEAEFDEPGHEGIRNRALILLGLSKDPRAIETIKTALTNPDVSIRCSAANAAGNVSRPELLQDVIPLTTDPDPLVKISAANSISKIGGEPAFKRVVDMLHTDPDPAVRFYAAPALINFSQRDRSIQALESALAEEGIPEIRDQIGAVINKIRFDLENQL